MIKGILFDLDGVLVSTQNLQVSSTLNALKHYCIINNDIKSLVKQTITTREKLQILSDGKYTLLYHFFVFLFQLKWHYLVEKKSY